MITTTDPTCPICGQSESLHKIVCPAAQQECAQEVERLREENRLVTEQNRVLNENLLKCEAELADLDFFEAELDRLKGELAQYDECVADNRCPQCGTVHPAVVSLRSQLSTSRQEGINPWHLGSEKPEKEGEYLLAIRFQKVEYCDVREFHLNKKNGWELMNEETMIAWMPIPPLPEVKP